MFTDVKEVDDHVKRLLSLSKNLDDNEMQCYTVANLYLNVKEYPTAKIYIDRHLKHKSNSEAGLLLKAKIHEEMNEQESALQCYESLYNISKRHNILTKLCESMLKNTVADKKAKHWIDIMESQLPGNQLLPQLKAKYSTLLVASPEELEKLKLKFPADKDNQVKRQYMSILERLNKSENPMSKCIELFSSYDIIDDDTIVRAALRIFKSCYSPKSDTLHTQVYSILLIAVIKNQLKSTQIDTAQNLATLFGLTKTNEVSTVNTELKNQFFFCLTSFAHQLLIERKEMSDEFVGSLKAGYSTIVRMNTEFVAKYSLPGMMSRWLSRQANLVKSEANHMTRGTDIGGTEWLSVVTNIVWPQKSDSVDMVAMVAMLPTKALAPTVDVIDSDLACFSKESLDFDLVMWQLMCYIDFAEKKTVRGEEIVIDNKGTQYISRLVKSIFGQLPLRHTHNRCPENVCQIDVVTYLLCCAMTYREASTGLTVLPLPRQCVGTSMRVTPQRWWHALCDFVFNNRRNTSIGPIREVLKRGLEALQVQVSVQGVDLCGEVPRMQVGRALAQCAAAAIGHGSDDMKEALRERSMVFITAALKMINSKAALPSTRMSTSSSQSLWQLGQSTIGSKTAPQSALFDLGINVSKATVDKWRMEAYLSSVDAGLHSIGAVNGNSVSVYDLEDMLDSVESMNGCAREELELRRARVNLAMAVLCRERGEVIRWEHLVHCAATSAELCANEGMEVSGLRAEIAEEERLGEVARDPIFDFTGDNARGIEGGDVEDTFAHVPSTADAHVCNNEMVQQVATCIEKIDTVRQTCRNDQHEIRLLQSQSSHHDSLYTSLMAKIEQLSCQMSRVSTVEDDYANLCQQNRLMRQEMNSLVSTIDELQVKNATLEASLDQCEQSILFYTSMRPQMTDLSNDIRRQLNGVQNIVQDHLNDHIDTAVILSAGKQRNRRQHKNKKPQGPVVVDNIMAKFSNANKWQCSICMVHNDNGTSLCLACNTAKPSSGPVKETKVVVSNGFDLSHLTRDKWECSTCMVHNDNSVSHCLACTTPKPGCRNETVQKPTIANNGFDLSRITSAVKEKSETIKFGFNTNQNFNQKTDNVKPIVFGSPVVNFSFGVAAVKEEKKVASVTVVANGWTCECTTQNSTEEIRCVACGEEKDDDDVVFVSGPFVTEEQMMRARALKLPDHFYHYENSPDYQPDDDEEEEQKVVIPVQAVQEKADEVDDEDNPEKFDAHYQPIVELAAVETLTGDEGWDCVFSRRCKLYRFLKGAWVERGIGEMKVVTRTIDGSKLSARMLMRRELVGRVCCSHPLVKKCPAFTPMGASKNAACWFAKDYSEGVEGVSEQFAVKFRTEDDLIEFKNEIIKVQDKIEE